MTPAANVPADRCSWIFDWLYPPRCRSCGESILGPDAECFCSACWKHLQLIGHPLCTCCGRPFPDASGDDHECGACLARPPEFTGARAWACYPREEEVEDPLRRVVHRFKYGRKVSLGKPLGRLMAEACQTWIEEWKPDVIVPVPLHPRRLRWRGFNQSALLGRQLSRKFGISFDPFILRRAAATPPQTKLSEDERRRNVRGAFAVDPAKPVRNKTLLIVDDVYTSGATVNECSRCLRRAGAKDVYVLTLARAIH